MSRRVKGNAAFGAARSAVIGQHFIRLRGRVMKKSRGLILGLALAALTMGVTISCSGQATPTPTPTPVPVTKTFPTPAPTPTPIAAAKSPTPAPAASPKAGETTTTASGNATAGKTAYAASCAGCHPLGASGVGPNLAGVGGRQTDAQMNQTIRSGKGIMPAFSAAQLTDAQLQDIIAYLKTLP